MKTIKYLLSILLTTTILCSCSNNEEETITNELESYELIGGESFETCGTVYRYKESGIWALYCRSLLKTVEIGEYPKKVKLSKIENAEKIFVGTINRYEYVGNDKTKPKIIEKCNIKSVTDIEEGAHLLGAELVTLTGYVSKINGSAYWTLSTTDGQTYSVEKWPNTISMSDIEGKELTFSCLLVHCTYLGGEYVCDPSYSYIQIESVSD
jgi:hypothetical protein